MMDGDPPTAKAQEFPRPFGSKYVLLKHLATGGMADVFLARQSGSAGFVKECVIKRILHHLARDEQFVTMFLDEARLCARLNHPNIAQVYDLGQVGDDYFIAMEHVHGVDLERVVDLVHERGEKYLPIHIAVRIVSGIAAALEHAHNAVDALGRPLRIVHRDVTPSNIVVSFDGVPKLLDFGIAKATYKQAKTEVGTIRGKAPYMSPEQVEGEDVDARSDIWSLGTVLYELTTGQKAFDGETQHKVGVKILHDDPTPPTLLQSDYPERLEAIVMKALAKRPNDRIPSARTLHEELEKFLTHLGLTATTHDVAAFVGERFPKERAQLSLVGRPAGPTTAPATPATRRPSEPRTDAAVVGDNEVTRRARIPTPRGIAPPPGLTAPAGGGPHVTKEPSGSSALPPPTESIGEAIARIRAATQPRANAVRPPTPTGPQAVLRPSTGRSSVVTIGDGIPVENLSLYGPRTNLGGGSGGRWMALVIAALILATGVGLLVLRTYQLRKQAAQADVPADNAASATPSTNPAAPATPTSAPVAATPTPSAPTPSAAPVPSAAPTAATPTVAPPTASPTAPTAAAPATPPAATVNANKPPVAEAAPTEKPAAKPKAPVHHEHHEPSRPLHELPHLPVPPPADNSN